MQENTDLPLDRPLKVETRDNMIIEWDVPIKMDDGLIVRADVFRPIKEGKYPVIMTYGCYGKGLAFQEGYKPQWEVLTTKHADALKGSSCKYYNWEVVDPEIWTAKYDYVCIRVDSRGQGRSKGFLHMMSPREIKDYYQCIEWAAQQPWSSGKIGLNGISYYGINQWLVAGLKPPHLTAMCAWEAAGDWYRDTSYHGGIHCDFWTYWYDARHGQIIPIQHGKGSRGYRSQVTGEWVSGPETLTEDQLVANRTDYTAEILEHPFADEWHEERSAKWDQIEVPFLSAGNWGGQGCHPRGNFAGYMHAASKEKWLEVHGLWHFAEFYTPYGVALQKQFFDYYLKGIDNGWKSRPKVSLKIRHIGDQFVERAENEWPLARTKWTKLYLDPKTLSLSSNQINNAETISYEGNGEGVTFLLPPLEKETEITGPVAAKLFVSSTTNDADLFLVLRVFDLEEKEVMFTGTNDARVPVAQGWLRASHRKLDTKRSTEWQPYHPHTEKEPLTPGQVYELDIEILPTSIVIPEGYRLALSVRSNDYKDLATGKPSHVFTHKNQPKEVLNNTVTIHAGGNYPSYVLLPIIPKE